MAIRKIVARSIGVDVITAEDLADNSITAAEITNGAVTADKLASNSVTTAKITDANVTTGKLATDLVVTHALGSASTPSITFTGDTNTGIFSPTADTIAFAEGGVESMRIDSSGQVGIGTTNPAAKLQSVSAAGTIQFRWSDATNGTANLDHSTGISRVWTNVGLAFGAGAESFSERMRIDSSGNLLVGTTSRGNTERVAILGNSGGSIVMSMERPGEGKSYIGSDSSKPFGVWDSTITNRFNVTSAGSCQNTTGSYGSFSDAKLKENIVDATPKLDDLMKVKVRNYGLKAEPNSKFIGFIAQEIREVFPSMIEENFDENENGEKTGEVTLAVKTTVLIPMLVKAIQELKTENDALKARLDAAGL
jgi:hypothetical protein